MAQESRRFDIRLRGPWACFTRPDMKVERVSYEVMTPSAARGAIEAVLWKPAIEWHIHTIAVLAPIAWGSVRRNEVNKRASPRGGVIFVEEERAQRNAVLLRDVDYVVTASFTMTERAGPEDGRRKFEEMFERRVEKGQHFHHPYLGCREFVADVDFAPSSYATILPGVDRPLGWMFYDFSFEKSPSGIQPCFFEARLVGGVLHVPPKRDVYAANRVTMAAAR